jgi:hypothetical protein
MKRGPLFVLTVLLAFAGCAPDAQEPFKRQMLEVVVADSGAGRPTAAIDARTGAVYVAYTAKDGDETNVYLGRLEDGWEALSEPVRVNDRAGDAAAHAQAPAQVAVGPDGTIYVAWVTEQSVEGRRFPASDIRLARSTDGGRTFEPAVTVNEEADIPTSHHFHNLAVGSDGRVFVSWLDGGTKDRARLGHARHETNSKNVVFVAMGHDGEGHNGEDGLPGTELRIVRSDDGGRTFGEEVVVARGTCECCRTALAVSESGTVYVAWRHIFEGGRRDMAIARSDDGGRTFTEPVRIYADDWQVEGCPHAGPALAVDEVERVHVAWYTGVRGRVGVYYTESRDGGRSFGEATTLAANVPIAQVSAAAGGPRDEAWIAWEDPLRKMVYVLPVEDGAVAPSAADSVSGSLPSLASNRNQNVMVWRNGGAIHLRLSRN